MLSDIYGAISAFALGTGGLAGVAAVVVTAARVIRLSRHTSFLRNHWRYILWPEFLDATLSIPMLGKLLSAFFVPTGRWRRVYDPYSADFSRAYELLEEYLDDGELDSKEDMRRWMEEYLAHSVDQDDVLDKYLIVAKKGDDVLGAAYLNFAANAAPRFSYVSFYVVDRSAAPSLRALARDALDRGLAVLASRELCLCDAVVFETSSEARFRALRSRVPPRTRGFASPGFWLLDIRGYAHVPLSPESHTLEGGLLAFRPMNARYARRTHLSVHELEEVLDFLERMSWEGYECAEPASREQYRNMMTIWRQWVMSGVGPEVELLPRPRRH